MTIQSLKINVWKNVPQHQKIVDIFMNKIQEECQAENKRIKGDVKIDDAEIDAGVVIPDHEYDKWTSEISKLKPKKQKLWKKTLTDKWGCKTKVRYEDGEFWNYCAAGSRINTEKGRRCKVRGEGQQLKDALKEGSTIRTGSLLGAASVVATKLKMIGETDMDERELKLWVTIIDGIWKDIQKSITDDNLTGNHYRNHTINVSRQHSLYGH